jgi:hypothetical protein
MFVFGANSASTGYNLTRSLRFRASASAYLNRTPATTTNQQLWTWSGWVKRGNLSSFAQVLTAGATSITNGYTTVGLNSTGSAYIVFYSTVSHVYESAALFRDPASWYHIVFAVDTTQATASNRIKMYVNGVQITLSVTSGYTAVPQNFNCAVNSTASHIVGALRGSAGNIAEFFDGYLTEVNFIDGQTLTPSSFGSYNALTGVWQAARYTGSYGTNGGYENFTDNSALTTASNVGLGKDFSGNANYWVTNNISITAGVTYDSMTDVPTLTSATAANFATWNPLDKTGSPTFSNGNLYVAGAFKTRSTMALPTGVKTYVEIYQTGTSLTVDVFCGLLSSVAAFPSFHANPGVNWYASDTIYGQLNGSAAFSFAGTLAGGAILQLAYDGSTGKVWLGINNTWYTSTGATSGNPSAGTGEFATLSTSTSWSVYCGSSTGSQTITAKFGQNGQSYTPPTGFVALNTYNLPTSTIVKGNTVMDATLYTGTGASLSVTNTASFKPDLVWLKSRSNATDNELTDSVRGVTKSLVSNSTAAEATDTQGLTAFNSNGFTLGTDANYNGSARTFVGWQWQAGQGSTSSNTNGTITSTVSVNASAGFSVVTYTGNGVQGATVGHGLGVAPQFIIVKNRGGANAWDIYSAVLGAGKYLDFSTAGTQTFASIFPTVPTSSVFYVGATGGQNQSSSTYVAYCWTPIAGFSAFGSYTGNGSTDGTFVYTGFRPKFVMIKRTDTTANWIVYDTARDTVNAATRDLFPNSSTDEIIGNLIDILSNGFKLRENSATHNASGGTYIFAAYAENPFRNALAR